MRKYAEKINLAESSKKGSPWKVGKLINNIGSYVHGRHTIVYKDLNHSGTSVLNTYFSTNKHHGRERLN